MRAGAKPVRVMSKAALAEAKEIVAAESDNEMDDDDDEDDEDDDDEEEEEEDDGEDDDMADEDDEDGADEDSEDQVAAAPEPASRKHVAALKKSQPLVRFSNVNKHTTAKSKLGSLRPGAAQSQPRGGRQHTPSTAAGRGKQHTEGRPRKGK